MENKIKITKKCAEYGIIGLAHSELFRIKHAMWHEAERMAETAREARACNCPRLAQKFEEAAEAARKVFDAISNYLM